MTVWTTVGACLLVACIWLFTRPPTQRGPPSWTDSESRAYILTNKVTHARRLPLDAKHAFTYPTLALLVSLDALERSCLDLPISLGWGPTLGYLFRFGPLWGTLLGLRGEGYLARRRPAEDSAVSIRAKLDRVLVDHGAIASPSEIRDVWMLTMPAVCAFEGINPLTIYYGYRPSGEVSVVVLEVHNTFGEGHVYVLQIGKDEDATPPKGYDHQWTFRRQFFVSPFNDRSGFYTVAVKLPSHAPFDLCPGDSPKPSIRVHLRTPDPSGALKLIAHLTPQRVKPLTTPHLLVTLARFPFALFATLPRILYQAWILHYRMRLPVFARPEPIPALSSSPPGGGIIYQTPTLFERYARQRTLAFLEQRYEETGISIQLVPGDPSVAAWRCPQQDDDDPPTLTLTYTSARVFTLLLLAPSARLFLYAGYKSKTDGDGPLFSVSNEDVYIRVFDAGGSHEQDEIERATQRMRSVAIPRGVFPDCTQLCHPFAMLPSSRVTRLSDLFVVSMLVIQDWVLERLFAMLKVRFAVGTEPWMKNIWKRASLINEFQ